MTIGNEARALLPFAMEALRKAHEETGVCFCKPYGCLLSSPSARFWLPQGTVEEGRVAAAMIAATPRHEDETGCGCSACEILRGEHDDNLDAWIGRDF